MSPPPSPPPRSPQPTSSDPTSSDTVRTRVMIVGAGPIGLELAVALTQQRVAYEIVDKGAIGQTISWWAPQTHWFSSNQRIAIAGVPLLTVDQSKATREEYLTYLRGVAEQFSIRVRSYEPVSEISRHEAGFTVGTQPTRGRRTYACEAIVLASGGTDRPRRLGIDGEDLPHVDGYLREVHRYYGRNVLIIGGRNSAVEAALRLYHAGAHVCLSYRGATLPEDGIKYWLRPEIHGLISSGRIGAHFGTRPLRITPEQVILQPVDALDTRQAIEVPADDVLSLIGYEQDKSLFHLAQLELLDACQRPQLNPLTMESSVAGIYVAGTAVAGTQSSRYKLFLENCHEHVQRIVAHLTGAAVLERDVALEREIEQRPES